MKQPQLGWTTPVELVKVIDGDTIRVKLVKEVDVRITDDDGSFDTPEIRRPADSQERRLGFYAKEILENVLENSEIVLYIPTDEDGQIKDVFSIGSRIVGHIFADGKDVTEILTKSGFNKNSENYNEHL